MRKGILLYIVGILTVIGFQNCGGYKSANLAQDSATQIQLPPGTGTTLSLGFNANLSGPNIVPLTVGACGIPNGINFACVTVTICLPGTTTCQTIPNISISTNDSGLRIYKSAVTLPLPSVTDIATGNPLGNCTNAYAAPYWGPVKSADVHLGGETAVSVPIQVVDSTFATPPSACANPASGPIASGANGVLGIGPFIYDCGPDCLTGTTDGMYYSCSGTTCSPSTASYAHQVTNPVALLPQDNNGVAITLPHLTNNHMSTAVFGSLILGIGTASNNIPNSAVTSLPTDGFGGIQTTLNGTSSKLYFISENQVNAFPNAEGVATCPAPNQSDLCAPTETILPMTLRDGASGVASVNTSITIGNVNSCDSSTPLNVVCDDAGYILPTGYTAVEVGIPFFFGKTIYFGVDSKQTPLGVGPVYGL